MFLTPDELSQLTGYDPRQRVRISRWLEEHGIPFQVNRLGDPVVLRSDVETPREERVKPNFDFLKRSA